MVREVYPNAEIVDKSTSRYNCHSYAWFNSQNNLALNDPSPFWLDGSYRKVTSKTIGNKIFYTSSGNEHSGIIKRTSGKEVISKWGPGPLVEHPITHCPYYVAPSVEPYVYYTR